MEPAETEVRKMEQHAVGDSFPAPPAQSPWPATFLLAFTSAAEGMAPIPAFPVGASAGSVWKRVEMGRSSSQMAGGNDRPVRNVPLHRSGAGRAVHGAWLKARCLD